MRCIAKNYEKAVYYPEDQKFLLKLDPPVTHYDVLVSPHRLTAEARYIEPQFFLIGTEKTSFSVNSSHFVYCR